MDMTDTRSAPTISVNKLGGAYPAEGTRIHGAWQALWDQLSLADEPWTDGTELANFVAEATQVHPDTVKRLLASARVAGLLEASYERTSTRRGPRTRAFYRIRAGA
jgi:hypothetical protein